jgi:hypothetical protein
MASIQVNVPLKAGRFHLANSANRRWLAHEAMEASPEVEPRVAARNQLQNTAFFVHLVLGARMNETERMALCTP